MTKNIRVAPSRFPGDHGEEGRHLLACDWSKTPLGAMETWPRCLASFVGMIARKPAAEAIFWGTDQIAIHNASYAQLLGRAPEKLGLSAYEARGELYAGMARAHGYVLRTGGSFIDDRCLCIARNGQEEEAHFTFRTSPLFDDEGAVAGVLQSVVETTAQVDAARRAITLSVLTASMRGATKIADAFSHGILVNPTDLPFAFLYLAGGASSAEESPCAPPLAATVGVHDERPDTAAFSALAARAWETGRVVVDDVERRFTPPHQGICGRVTRSAVALPLRHDSSSRPFGVVVLGASPVLRMDEAYASFFEAVAERLSDQCARHWLEAEGRVSRDAADTARVTVASASQATDELVAMLGHELRSPLAPIASAVERMKRHRTDDFRREREIIARQTAHLVDLVDALLDTARTGQGQIELKREPVEIWEPLEDAIEMVAPHFEQAGHSLAMGAPRRDLVVEGDARRLRQIFSNLLNNAAKFTPRGGHIEIEVTRMGEQIAIAVRDDGPGISENLAPRIFEPFVQGEGPRAKTQGGLGLGLAIVRHLVDLHGGTVTAQNRGEAKGSSFVVLLPAAPQATPATWKAQGEVSQHAPLR